MHGTGPKTGLSHVFFQEFKTSGKVPIHGKKRKAGPAHAFFQEFKTSGKVPIHGKRRETGFSHAFFRFSAQNAGVKAVHWQVRYISLYFNGLSGDCADALSDEA